MPAGNAQRKYKLQNIRRYCVDFNKKTESALIERLDRAKLGEGYSAYIKSLIAADLEAEQAHEQGTNLEQQGTNLEQVLANAKARIATKLQEE